MKASTLLATAAASLSLLALGARADHLHIEPFDEGGYSFESPSGARLVSTNDGGYDGMATTGVTRVYAPSGALLYEIPVFSGRKEIFLSPDATIVVLDGNWYFGTRYMKIPMYEEGDPVVTQVYLRGESWKNVTYNGDLGGPPLAEEAQFGWSHRPFVVDVDWTRHVLSYDVGENVTFHGNVTHRRRAEATKHVEISLPGLWDFVVGDYDDDDDDDYVAGSSFN